MNLTQTTVVLPKSEIENFVKEVPQSVSIEGYVFIREDVLREILDIRFDSTDN